jgi:hypothetical protein
MESQTFDQALVILPDGRLDPNAAHLIPPDVHLEPIVLPTISRNPFIQERYEIMRLRGESHNMAEILATRKFPGSRTDREFNAGRVNGNQFEHVPGLGDYYRKIAEEAGVSVTGKFYCSGLASWPGDPTAWVSDRGDVLRVAREKGLRVSGHVDYDPGEPTPAADVPIADDLVESEVEDILESNPGASADDVRDRVIQLRTGQVDPNPLLVAD